MTAEWQKLYRKIKTKFSEIDKDSDGYIVADEVETYMKSLDSRWKKADSIAYIKEVDRNGDGKINFDEFLAVSLFTHVDKDLSDFISVDEMKTMFVELFGDWNEMSDQYVDQKMLEIDKDGDGKANFQEFCSVLKSCKNLLRLEKR